MIIFSIYALLIWWGAYTGRRTWRGFSVAIAGAVVVLPAIDPLVYLAWMMMGERPNWLFIFFYAYSAVIALAGVFLATMPRADANRPCHKCGYDLHGIDAGVCPECGERIIRRRPSAGRTTSTPRPAPRR